VFFLCALIALICGSIFTACETNHRNSQTDYERKIIRLHIRAHSDSANDQAVKLTARDGIIDFLEPRLAVADGRADAYRIVDRSLGEIKALTDDLLLGRGFLYGSRAGLNNEFFPTRSYEGIVIPGGYYDALIIELGDGAGQNWWCVIYPPLCFVGRQNGSNGFEYRSIIRDLWDRWFG